MLGCTESGDIREPKMEPYAKPRLVCTKDNRDNPNSGCQIIGEVGVVIK